MAAKHTVAMMAWMAVVLATVICGQAITAQQALPDSRQAGKDNVPPTGFRALFNGKDFTGWNVPEGDNGHWKIIDGVIDYDAQSEARDDKNLWHTENFKDFVLRVDWRIKDTPYINPRIAYILPDGTHARDIEGKELKLALPDCDSGIFLRGARLSGYQVIGVSGYQVS